MSQAADTGRIRSAGRHILFGLLTIAPLAITWFILDFLFNQLSNFGRPWVSVLSAALRPRFPNLADWLLDETLQSVAAVVIMLVFLYVLGWTAGRVIGQRFIRLFERLVGLVPFVDGIYRATKRFLTVAGNGQDSARRVVLIEFPGPGMKTVGLLTKTMRDRNIGEELAVVYVPTAPNPTSGYIEIVPMKNVVLTDWSFDQAMSFVVTGGSSAPEEIDFNRSQDSESSP